MRSRKPAHLALLVSTAFALAFSAPGCALQNEGERCSQKNDNADCGQDANGEQLVCTSASALGGQSDICCKPNNKSELPACIPSTSGGTTSSSSTSASSSASATSGSGVGGMGGAGSTTGAGGAAGAGGTGGTGG